MPTIQEYNEDFRSWGLGQWVSLKDIVDEYINGLTEADITYSTKRGIIVKKAKHAIRELKFSTLKEYLDVEIDLSSTLQVALPRDYVDYGLISWVDEIGNLYPLAQNPRISIAKGILQDSDYQYIYDNNGEKFEALIRNFNII